MANVLNSHSFFMKLSKIPTGTAQQRHYNRITGMSYPSASYVQAKKTLTNALRPHRLPQPYTGVVLLEVEYRYETKEKKKINTFKTTRPDGDNLLKVLKDCMIGSYFLDDSQVSIESISRYYVPVGEGGIAVRIKEISREVF